MALLTAAAERGHTPAPTPNETASVPRRSGTRRIEEIASEHRARWKNPFKRAPRTVE